jgi:erythromycin esterase-like protein
MNPPNFPLVQIRYIQDNETRAENVMVGPPAHGSRSIYEKKIRLRRQLNENF